MCSAPSTLPAHGIQVSRGMDGLLLYPAGSRMVILSAEEGASQSTQGSGERIIGELALVPPFLGASQRLLNADHYRVYYEVRSNNVLGRPLKWLRRQSIRRTCVQAT